MTLSRICEEEVNEEAVQVCVWKGDDILLFNLEHGGDFGLIIGCVISNPPETVSKTC